MKRTIAIIATAVAGAAGVLAGCGSDPISSSGQPATTSSTATTEPAPDVTPPAPETSEENGRTILNREMGKPGRDGDVLFTVTKVDQVSSIPTSYGPPLRAVSGAKLVRVAVTVRNVGRQSVDPFCGGGEAVLIDQQERNFRPHQDQYNIAGNDYCTGVDPGFQQRVTLAFQVPRKAVPYDVAFWDDDEEGDFFGAETAVRFNLRAK